MVLSDAELRELATKVLALLINESQGIDEVPVAESTEGINSLPAYQLIEGVLKTVTVPLTVFAKPAIDAAATATEVTGQARIAIADTAAATELALEAAGSVDETKAAAAAATETALAAANSVDDAKKAAAEATTLALKAKDSALRAADDADTVTASAAEQTLKAEKAATAAATAATLANNNAVSAASATKNATAATDDCKKATAANTESGALARTAAGKAEEQIVRMQELASSIGESGSLAPSIMELTYLKKITLGNPVAQKIVALLKPEFVVQNILFLGDDKAVSVDPAGQLTLNGPGKSRIYVIPTDNTRLYQTIEIEVQKPVMRFTGDGYIRFDQNGNIRLI